VAGVIAPVLDGVKKQKGDNSPFSEFLGALKNGATPVLHLSCQHQNGR